MVAGQAVALENELEPQGRDELGDAVYRPAMMLLRATYLTVDEHKELLSAAGYLDVATFVKPENGWICVLGTKPT
jgi:hypothetical protein